MFVGRLLDGTIYGIWAKAQPDDEHHKNITELPASHPDVVAFQNRPLPVDPRDTKIAELEARLNALERKP